MPLLTLVTGGLLIAVGLLIGLTSDSSSLTRFIPAFIGLPILIAGMVSVSGTFRKHAIHAALLIALLGVLGAGARIPAVFSDGTPAALTAHVLLVLICGAYIALGVRSFIRARRERKAAPAATA